MEVSPLYSVTVFNVLQTHTTQYAQTLWRYEFWTDIQAVVLSGFQFELLLHFMQYSCGVTKQRLLKLLANNWFWVSVRYQLPWLKTVAILFGNYRRNGTSCPTSLHIHMPPHKLTQY